MNHPQARGKRRYWLLRQGDTRAAKLVTLIIWGVLGMAILGLINKGNIVPSERMCLLAFVLGGGGGLALCVALWRDAHPDAALGNAGFIKSICMTLAAFTTGGALAYFAALLGWPYLWSLVALQPSEATVKVAFVLSEGLGKGCHHKIGIEGGPMPQRMSPCVSEALWKSVRSGDPLVLRYTDGAMAFVIDDIRLPVAKH